MLAQSAGAVEYTDASLQRGKNPPTSVLDMTLNNLMVRFQQCRSFGECGIPLYCLAQSAGAVEYTDCFSAEG